MTDREAMQMSLEIIGTHHRLFKHETTAREVMEMALEIMENNPGDYENQIIAIRAKLEQQMQTSPADTQRKRTMTPIDFVVFEGDSMPNQPVYQIAEAMQKPIKIHSFNDEWEVVKYYFDDGHMVLDITEKNDD